MNTQIIQNLRYKLQKRVRRLNSANVEVFASVLQQFWTFFDNEPTLSGILQNIIPSYPSITETVDKLFGGTVYLGGTEEEGAVIGYEILRRIKDEQSMRDTLEMIRDTNLSYSSRFDENLNTFRDVFLEPFYEYIDEQLDDQRAILSLIYRYKHKCEWFQQEQLLKLYESETKKGEKLLALDLYQYLFEQGIDFVIEPSSIDGAIDLISAQNSDDPLLADAKVFKGDKGYICKGFGQLYSYTKKYNEPFGYLVIYNVTANDLSFLFSNSTSNIPVVTYNHKTIFLITIDLYKHSEPPSKRGLVRPFEIREEEFFEFIEKNPSE